MFLRSTCCALALLLFPSVTAVAQGVSDSGGFVVRRGRDTVATEQFTRTATKLEGTLTLRNAKRTSERWSAVIAPDATLPLVEVTVREGSDSSGRAGKVVQRARVIFKEDSVAVDVVGERGVETRLFATKRGAVPYLNLSFALLEQAVRRARASTDTSQVAFHNLGGGQTLISTLSRVGADSLIMNIGHVQLRLQVDPAGRVLGAWIPSQDLTVERR